MKDNFQFGQNVAKWVHIKTFHNKEQILPIRTAPMEIHSININPNGFQEIKVKFAFQVFNHSVAAGMFTNVSLCGLQQQQNLLTK